MYSAGNAEENCKMEDMLAQYQESAAMLRARLGAFRPRCLLILGSGLGAL